MKLGFDKNFQPKVLLLRPVLTQSITLLISTLITSNLTTPVSLKQVLPTEINTRSFMTGG